MAAYDAISINLNQIFVPPPHFGAKTSTITTILRPGHMWARPRYGSYPVLFLDRALVPLAQSCAVWHALS